MPTRGTRTLTRSADLIAVDGQRFLVVLPKSNAIAAHQRLFSTPVGRAKQRERWHSADSQERVGEEDRSAGASEAQQILRRGNRERVEMRVEEVCRADAHGERARKLVRSLAGTGGVGANLPERERVGRTSYCGERVSVLMDASGRPRLEG